MGPMENGHDNFECQQREVSTSNNHNGNENTIRSSGTSLGSWKKVFIVQRPSKCDI